MVFIFLFIGFVFAFILQLQPQLSFTRVIDDGFMFFASGGEEKTEKASHKKLQDAKKKGQVVKSTDVNNMVILVSSFVLLSTFGPLIIEDVKQMMEYFFINSYNTSVLNVMSNELILLIVNLSIKVLLFIFLPLMIFGVAGNVMQTGFISSQEGLKPKFDKLNPINGFKEMFSRKRILSGLKSIFLLVIVFFMSYSFIIGRQEELLALPYLLYQESLITLGAITSSFILQILMLVVAVAAVDYGIQRFEFMRSMKMTKQEVKEEYKQMEGDPFVKGKRRQKQREISMGSMMTAVSEATVVVTNPTHYAIAIKYVHDEDLIPKVVAKGVDFRAQKIKELAKELEVPIIENKPLARTLHAMVKEEEEIPTELYKAVAEILAIVYKLEKKQDYY